ncbi:ADP-ribosylglycohydrolase family protein [Microbacterium sp. ET2]|uniref:ADP-ribosylglycohydrolase family protein n=1 Tax=Microbacterium albipurpureum TaxID=3050384 RepID=UPI00259CDEC4|nr:ADP-ribosylglycohydrolase family protein [Microbacterium sp. ET2 (Ac-2212)]WJL97046.1 ADP-ribosylglycohydrolase family protein [Microbacterium sp. ET2 (Ac-2212)]
MKKPIAVAATAAASIALLVAAPAAQPADAATLTITKASYADKTLAGIIGQVGGFLSGYEFHPTYGANPMPDSCFELTKGPYSGDAPASCWTPNGYPGYDRLGAPNFASNELGSDDDYHVDFFLQHVLDASGPDVSFGDIKREWVEHDVRDFGPGKIANDTMRQDNFYAPATGQAEYNRFFWLTEGYIETETLGMVAPGMPETARALGDRFGQITTEFDSVEWASLFTTMYSLGYFATDARDVLHEAVKVLPRGGWPRAIYDKVVALHAQNPSDWRWAQGQLMQFVRNVYQNDNNLALPDRNNGAAMIAILYGGNDYVETIKIASLSGNDADCTAATVGGLMGIIKGMAGTPQAFKDRIYQNGNGRYINDTVTGFDPFIAANYPTSQSWDSLAALYQANAEDQIIARGGSVGATTYTINGQDIAPPVDILINNYDFEHGTLAGWTKTTVGTDTGSPNAFAEDNGTALSGQWKGTVFTDSSVDEVRLATTVSGLVPGQRYRLEAFVQSDVAARLFLDTNGGSELFADVVGSTLIEDREWVLRSVEFVSGTSTARIGLHMPSSPNNGYAAIDDVKLFRVSQTPVTYEAEDASIAGGDVRTGGSASGGEYVGGLDAAGNYVQFAVSATQAGEQRLLIHYANGTGGFSATQLAVNGTTTARIPLPRTAGWGSFSRNTVAVPVDLNAGSNTIRLTKPADGSYAEIDRIELAPYPTPHTAPLTSVNVTNADFDASGPTGTPSGWTTWPGASGTHADADYTEGSGFTGSNRLTHAKSSPYEVYTSQTLTGLSNGTYTVTAWAMSSGGQSAAFLSAKGYATGAPEMKADLPSAGFPHWRRITISGIPVSNGQLQIGLYSNAAGGQWSSIDGIKVYKQ